MYSRRKVLGQALGLSVAAAASGLASEALAAVGQDKQPTTKENLLTAFAGESQANRKYTAFAEQADKEGLKQLALMFRAIAASETIHALQHLRSAGLVGSSMENMQHALDGETYEFTQMYPEMAKIAAAEGDKSNQQYFDWANKVEAGHADLYKKAISAKGNIAATDYYLCSVCGYTNEGPYSGACPICKAPASAFFKFVS